MILDVEKGSVPSENPEHDMLWYKFSIGDEQETYGVIRYEIIPSAAITHVYPVGGVTKKKLQELKRASDLLLQDFLIDVWNFNHVYYTTNNTFLIKLLSRGVYEEVGFAEGMPIYRSNIREVLCHTQS